jgi:hypothetical protein
MGLGRLAVSANVEKLRHMWGRFVCLGASDNDLHQLVTLAQDMELARVCEVLKTVQELGANSSMPPQVLTVIRLIREELELKAHRPAGYR